MEALQRLYNRGSISTGYDIDNSLKFEADNTEYLTRTPSSAGNEKTWTWSGWIKYIEPTLSPQTVFAGGTDSGSYGAINFRLDAGKMELNTASVELRHSTQRFRDASAWYHFVVAMDTTQSTADDRIKIYVNGSQITDFSVSNNPPQNTDTGVNANELQTISRRSHANDRYFAGYMAELHLIDGTALTPTSFGEYDNDSGIWKPKAYTGSYGTNGYYLDFESSGSLGADSSGNGNNFTLNNITAADQATDTPTNNFCTLNPLMISNRVTITNGGTSIISAGVDGNSTTTTMGVSNGKWYWEFYMTSNGGTAYWPAVGYTTDPSQTPDESAGGSGTPSKVALLPNGGTFVNGSIISSQFNTFSANDIAGFALDMDNGNMYIYKNGTIQNSGSPIFTSIGDFAMPVIDTSANAPAGGYFNFGGYAVNSISSAASDENGYGTFEYAPPSGYYALCTKNLEEYG